MTEAEVAKLQVQHDQPVPFGHEMLRYFAFDPEYINMNHGSYCTYIPRNRLHTCGTISGSYGSLPIPVAKALEKYDAMAEGSAIYLLIHSISMSH